MTDFLKYQHVERFGQSATRGIELGECVIFPKVDGSNASVWLDGEGNIKAGSRTRELEIGKHGDNAGFYAFVLENKNINNYLQTHPTHRLFGEWLVPHSLKTYHDDAWKKFYVFDVVVGDEENLEYIPYDDYKEELDRFELDYIVPIAIIKNGSYEQFIRCLEKNSFLIKDGEGVGEGVVIKNYGFKNQFGRQVWAKIVTNEFKEKHAKTMGVSTVVQNCSVEQSILEELLTESFIEKEFAKLVGDRGGEWSSKYIGEFLGRLWHEFITEEIWEIVKKHRNPTINFKTLNYLFITKVKTIKSDIF